MNCSLWKFSIGLHILITVLSTVFIGCLRLDLINGYDKAWLTDPGAEPLLFFLVFFGIPFSIGFMDTNEHLGIATATCTASVLGLLIARDIFSGVGPEGTIVVYGMMWFFFCGITMGDKLMQAIGCSIPFMFQIAIIGLTASAEHVWLPLVVYVMFYAVLIWLFFFVIQPDTKQATS